MPPDSHDFFLEGKRQAFYTSKRDRELRAILIFSVSAGYALLVFAVAYFNISGQWGLSLLALYFSGVLGGYGILLMKQGYKNAERSRKILTGVLEKSAEARLILDDGGEPVYVNERFAAMVHGMGAPSLQAFTRMGGTHEDKVKSALDDLRARAAPAGSATAEVPVRTGDRPAWFQVTCQFIAGWPGYTHWRFDDITHRFQMQAMIREEREKLRDFTDNAPVGFFSVDEDGTFRFANDTMLKLLGTDARTLIGHARLHDFLVSPPKGGEAYDCFAEGGSHQHGELLMRGAGGRSFKAAVTHSIARTVEGQLISRSIVYDLTAEQKMRQALLESEDRFQRLFEEAPVGICMVSAEGAISNANQTLGAMLRLPPDSLNGRPLTHFVHRDSQRKAAEWLAHVARDGGAERHIDLMLTGAAEVFAQIYARRLKSGNALVLHFIDLTEQKNLERQFAQSQKMQAVGQLAGGVAHDFNNLLTAMIGFCDLLLLRHKPGDPSFADIMQIKQNANRAANLVRQLLAFSRQQTLQPRVLDVTDVLSELSHLMRRLIGANIELKLVHGQDLGLIRADQGQIEQVMINLVVNARDAMQGGGKLTISTRNVLNDEPRKLNNGDHLPPGKWTVIEVEDSGSGIMPDILPRIFEPFFSTKEVGAGTGLGLATVHGIVHQTGGHIDVQSSVGSGATFIIYLPHYEEREGDRRTAEEKPHAVTDLTGSSRILLVEDEDAVRTFSARALSNKGYQVADAPSGEAALRLLEEGRIDPEILITDVMMPEMDGTALAKIVREKYPHIKIIFISGYAEDRFKEHLGEGVWFLPKPFTLKQLATKVKEVIEEG